MKRLLAFVFSLCVLGLAQAADTFKPEEGFTMLFNGKDFDGWKISTYKDKDKGEAIGSKSETPTKRYTVKDEVIIIDAKVKGDMIITTEKTFAKDVHIKFDFKPGKGCNNDLIFRGMKFDIKPEEIKSAKLDEWNTFEIELKGDKAEFKCNGEVIKTLAAKPAATSFGIRAEGGPIEVRRIRVKE
jgi:hypothetical protein